MMECRGDNHQWFLANVDQSKVTAPFIRATWLCACGGYKVVDHEVDVREQDHPDFRLRQMKARAEMSI